MDEIQVGEDDNLNEENEEFAELNAADLENIAILYDSIRSVRRRIEKNMDKKLAEDFD